MQVQIILTFITLSGNLYAFKCVAWKRWISKTKLPSVWMWVNLCVRAYVHACVHVCVRVVPYDGLPVYWKVSLFTNRGIPGKKCGTIIVKAEELNNCRVRYMFYIYIYIVLGIAGSCHAVALHDTWVVQCGLSLDNSVSVGKGKDQILFKKLAFQAPALLICY